MFYIISGESTMLTTNEMFFVDKHSTSESLIYTLAIQPKYGELSIRNKQSIDYRGADAMPIHITNKFSQEDVISGLITYTSTAEVGMKGAVEHLLFNVTDPSNNVLSGQVMVILFVIASITIQLTLFIIHIR